MFIRKKKLFRILNEISNEHRRSCIERESKGMEVRWNVRVDYSTNELKRRLR